MSQVRSVAILGGAALLGSVMGDAPPSMVDDVLGHVHTEAQDCVNVGTCDRSNPVPDCNAPQWECEFPQTSSSPLACSDWDATGRYDPKGLDWPLQLSWFVGAVMAFGIGGNDSANSLATTVGSGALSLRKAVIMGAFGEWLGSTFLGAGVSGTIRRGVADVESEQCWACSWCNSKMDEYQVGMIAALFGAGFFLLLITFFALPVSTTHSCVGGVVGMTIAGVGWNCLNWSIEDGLGRIVAGWVVSPLAAGGIGMALYAITYYFIMRAKDPQARALCYVPIMYGASFSTMLLLVLIKSSTTKEMDTTLKYIIAGISFPVVSGILQIFIVPSIRKEMEEAAVSWETRHAVAPPEAFAIEAGRQGSRTSQVFEPLVNGATEVRRQSSIMSQAKGVELGDPVKGAAVVDDGHGLVIFTTAPPNKDQVLAKIVFRNLLIMTSFLECFGHGANDTANATGPLSAVQFAYEGGIYACGARASPVWLTSLAGMFVGVGVITLGYRVIKTIGSDLTDIDFQIGFCVEFASAFSVVIATILNIPVSTTHCQVGAVIFVAFIAYGPKAVVWGLFGKIAVSWAATLPAAGGLAWLATNLYIWTR